VAGSSSETAQHCLDQWVESVGWKGSSPLKGGLVHPSASPAGHLGGLHPPKPPGDRTRVKDHGFFCFGAWDGPSQGLYEGLRKELVRAPNCTFSVCLLKVVRVAPPDFMRNLPATPHCKSLSLSLSRRKEIRSFATRITMRFWRP